MESKDEKIRRLELEIIDLKLRLQETESPSHPYYLQLKNEKLEKRNKSLNKKLMDIRKILNVSE